MPPRGIGIIITPAARASRSRSWSRSSACRRINSSRDNPVPKRSAREGTPPGRDLRARNESPARGRAGGAAAAARPLRVAQDGRDPPPGRRESGPVVGADDAPARGEKERLQDARVGGAGGEPFRVV